MKNIFYLLCFSFICCQLPSDTIKMDNQYAIIPQPLHLEEQLGGFFVKNNAPILVNDSALLQVASFLNLAAPKVEISSDIDINQAIIFKLNKQIVNESAYTLSVTPKRVLVQSKTPQGAFRAIAKTTAIDNKNTVLEFPVTEARFLKIKATNLGTIPAGATGAGHSAWLFLDEIMVE